MASIFGVEGSMSSKPDSATMPNFEEPLTRQALYNLGLSDGAIAQREGVHKTSVRDWRKSRGLPLNPAPPVRLEKRDTGRRSRSFIGPHQPTEIEQMRWKLYGQGLNDPAIALATGERTTRVFEWRKKRGLPAHLPPGRNSLARSTPLTDELRGQCLTLLLRGVGARLIGRELGVSEKTLDHWRSDMLRGDPALRRPTTSARRVPTYPNGRRYSKMRAGRRRAAFLLYADGLDDAEIASKIGVNRQQVCEWRGALFLPAIGTPYRRRKSKQKVRVFGPAITPHSNPLHAAIAEAIGRNLAPDIADDAISEMWLALAEGRLTPERIAVEAAHFRGRTVRAFANPFGPRSLDEDLSADGDGFRMIDLLRDDRSSSWLEEMGATVW